LTPHEVVDHFMDLTSPRVVHAVCDAAGLSVVVEAVDEVTGLSVREAWSFSLEAGAVTAAHIVCGGSLQQTRRALAHREVEPFLAGFGLRYPEPEDGALIERAAEAVAAHEGHPISFERHDALVNDDLIYVPYGWIGCCGFLVARSTWTATLLGSGIPKRVHVWAYYRGFADGPTSNDRPNDLVILAVRDPRAAQRALKRVGKVPAVDQLPFRFRNVDLYFSREALWRAEIKGDLEFHVEPPSGAA
jgi:hypothetical protein